MCSEIDEATFTSALDLSYPPDLLIRTSGEQRLSDFLLWQVKCEKSIMCASSITSITVGSHTATFHQSAVAGVYVLGPGCRRAALSVALSTISATVSTQQRQLQASLVYQVATKMCPSESLHSKRRKTKCC